MRIIGVILVVIGILMAVFNGFDFQQKKTIVDTGALKISRKEDKHIGLPLWADGLLIICGVVLFAAGKKK